MCRRTANEKAERAQRPWSTRGVKTGRGGAPFFARTVPVLRYYGSASFVGKPSETLPFSCPSVQQGAANCSKGRHKANAENRSILAARCPTGSVQHTSAKGG